MPLTHLRDGNRKATKGKLRAPAQRVATDPPIEYDAPCIVCGGERRYIAQANEDPFCSTVCCRRFCGVGGL